MYQDFIQNIQKGNLNEVINIYNLSVKNNNPINIHATDEKNFDDGDDETPFIYSCWYGHFDIAKWLWELSLNINSPIDITKHKFLYATPFHVCCKRNHLEMAKWIWNLSKSLNIYINIHFDKCGNSLWAPICCSGYLEMAKWLFNLSKEINSPINLHIGDTNRVDGNNLVKITGTNGFVWSCLNCHLEMAQWLFAISNEMNTPYDIYNGKFKNELFLELCNSSNKNNINILKWLWDLSVGFDKPYDLHKKDERIFSYNMNAFQFCCRVGNREAAEWLLEISYKINKQYNIYENNDLAFRSALYCGHYDTVKWLIGLSKQYKKDFNINPNNECEFILRDDDTRSYKSIFNDNIYFGDDIEEKNYYSKFNKNIINLLNSSYPMYEFSIYDFDLYKKKIKGEKISKYFVSDFDLYINDKDSIEI
jgi:hypothetical protein